VLENREKCQLDQSNNFYYQHRDLEIAICIHHEKVGGQIFPKHTSLRDVPPCRRQLVGEFRDLEAKEYLC
jgi:hypothetical protein